MSRAQAGDFLPRLLVREWHIENSFDNDAGNGLYRAMAVGDNQMIEHANSRVLRFVTNCMSTITNRQTAPQVPALAVGSD